MSFPNFFKRKSLLSHKGETADDPPAAEMPSDPSEVFTRPTMVPDFSADIQAAEAMRAMTETDAALTSPAPRPEADSALGERETIQPIAEPMDWASFSQATDLREGLSPYAIPPPSRTTQAALWHPDRSATGRTLSDLQIDSGATLDFVDGHARSTNRPGFDPFDLGTEGLGDELIEAPRLSAPISVSDLYAVGDFSGALELAEQVLEHEPNDPSALRYAEDCRRVLLKMCEARIGPFSQRPTVVMGAEQIRWLALDHREGFLLSIIDGGSTVDDLLDISGMPRLDALRIFAALIDKGVVKMR